MNNSQKGFSLIEILIVLVIVGVLAAISFPLVARATQYAENNVAFSHMRTISSGQVTYFSQHQRFARLDELNTAQDGRLGRTAGDEVFRGKFRYQMNPAAPTDDELKSQFTIIATKASLNANEAPYVISLSESGEIVQILP